MIEHYDSCEWWPYTKKKLSGKKDITLSSKEGGSSVFSPLDDATTSGPWSSQLRKPSMNGSSSSTSCTSCCRPNHSVDVSRMSRFVLARSRTRPSLHSGYVPTAGHGPSPHHIVSCYQGTDNVPDGPIQNLIHCSQEMNVTFQLPQTLSTARAYSSELVTVDVI